MRTYPIATLGLVFLMPFSLAHAGANLFDPPQALSNACGAGDGCWTNYLRVTDLNGDHQLDVVTVNMQGFFSVGAGEPLAIYINDPAGTFDNVSTEAIGGHSGQHRQVAIGDIDGDGDPDIYAPHAAGGTDSLFLNNGDATFEETTFENGSEAGAARFGDLDNDGDLDLFLTHSYPDGSGPVSPAARVWINDGTGAFEELVDATPPEVAGSQPIDVDLFDADGDFDLDALIDTHDGPLAVWLNAGDGSFQEAPTPLDFSPSFHYGPGVCDVDGDGDLDFWVDNATDAYTEQLHINDGTGAFSDETAARVVGNPGADDNGVICVDFDYDGDFDAVVVSLGSRERYLQNDGAGNFTHIPSAFPSHPPQAGNPSTVPSLWAEFGDLDNDGRLDVVTGSGESGTQENFYLGAEGQMTDTVAPAFRSVEQAPGQVEIGTAVVIRYAVTDNTVTDEGPRLDRAFVRVSVDGGDPTEVDARFMGGDLFRAELPSQAEAVAVSYSVCAVDWAGNEGCAEPLEYDVEGGSAETGDSGADTSGGTNPTDPDSGEASASESATASDTATNSGNASDPTSTAGSESSSSGNDQNGGGDGCGCNARGHDRGAWLGAAMLMLGLLGRSRSPRRPTASSRQQRPRRAS